MQAAILPSIVRRTERVGRCSDLKPTAAAYSGSAHRRSRRPLRALTQRWSPAPDEGQAMITDFLLPTAHQHMLQSLRGLLETVQQQMPAQAEG